MKTKIYYFLFISIAFTTIFSCSKTEENIPLISSIELKSTSPDDLVAVNEPITFNVNGDDGINYNNEAKIFVGQAEISGSEYAFTESGVFDVFASFNGLTSNILSFEVVSGDRNLLIDATTAFRNQPINLSLVDIDGNDVSDTATFYVNDTAISGNSYTSANEGNYAVYAEYDVAGNTETSETKKFRIFTPKRKVVIEDYTGAWCGFCPSVAQAIIETHEVTNDISIVAIHETANSFPDPYHFDDIQLLKDAFGIAGLPGARINRTSTWDAPYESSDVLSMAGEDTNLSMAIDSNISGETLTVNIDVLFENGSTAGDKLVVYLVENGIIYPQVNYYNDDPTSIYYQLGNPIPEFEHNETLRQSLSGIFGDAVASTASYGLYKKSFTTTIPSDYVNDNLEIVVMLVSSDNTARNSQHAKVGEAKDFE